MRVLDIAHPPLSSAEAEAVLDDALRAARLSPAPILLKVIHGYGSRGRGGALKIAVQNWAYRNRNQIRRTIDGDEIAPFNPVVQKLARECNLAISTIGRTNPGVTLIWVK